MDVRPLGGEELLPGRSEEGGDKQSYPGVFIVCRMALTSKR